MTPGYPPIDEYAFLSDTHTGALVAPDGTVEWLPLPTYDSGSVFGQLLDRQRGGGLRLAVAGAGAPARRYVGDSLVLESRYETTQARVTVHDFLAVREDPQAAGGPFAAEHLLVRLVRTRGEAQLQLRVDAQPDYARTDADWQPDGAHRWQHRKPAMWLATSHPLRSDGTVLTGAVALADGETFALVLGYADTPAREVDEAERLLHRSCRVWQDWSDRSDYAGIGRELVRRSAVLLRGLAFDESGALLAAATTSLPEEIGGVRNWDYRFTWYRDAALLMLALFRLGHQAEGAHFLRFLLHTCAADPQPPPLVGINGEHRSEEIELTHLSGYADSPPVRIGNDAYGQRQLDTYGHLLDAALAYQQLTGELQPAQWQSLRRFIEQAADRWQQPDHGIWEIRGPCRHYVNSKVMLWVCLDRGARLAELLADDDAPRAQWRQTADVLREEVLRRGFDEQLNSFVMAYDLPVMDASLLRIPLVGFLPGDDPRVLGTIDRIRAELAVEGTPLIYRYDLDALDDGLPGEEGAFLLCSFELLSALVLAGRLEEARAGFDWLSGQAGALGLFSEQLAPDGTALGNYPQALTHLGLIEAAVNLESAGSTEALHEWAAARGGTA